MMDALGDISAERRRLAAFALAAGLGVATLPTGSHPAPSHKRTALTAEQRLAALKRALAIAAIQSVLLADARTASIQDYSVRTAAMRQIDLQACPIDFRTAYQDHIAAWAQAAEIQKTIETHEADDDAQSLPARAASPAGGAGRASMFERLVADRRLGKRRGQAADKVRDTFRQVELVTRRHGAKPFDPEAIGQ